MCEEVIKEPIATWQDGQAGGEAVFCEGRCATWSLGKRSGLSKSVYTMAGESESLFHCVHCM